MKTETEVFEEIENDIKKHPVILFMKGTKEMPMCGFSGTVVEILKLIDVPFETRNVLDDEALRAGIKAFSNWPTIPQLYINGEFIGGCDIVTQLYETGQLSKEKILETHDTTTRK
ncbi:MAG: Grx4 family monothiol glutaredoxin [Simkaniaceae bacterium]|nr:Grx4 family monothiol glutaredoxin [Simkaniaceae bacterium]